MDPTLGSVTSYNVVWYLADASGQKVDSLRKGGKDVDLGENHRLASKDGNGDAGPGVWAYANVPAGSSVQPPTSVPGVDGAVSSRVIQLIDRNAQDNNGQDSTSPGTDSMGNESASSKFNWDSPIESTDVTVDLAHLDHILPSFLKCIYQFILAPLIRLAAGLCQWLLKLVDPSKMVDGNFSGGTYKELYVTATKINDNVAGRLRRQDRSALQRRRQRGFIQFLSCVHCQCMIKDYWWLIELPPSAGGVPRHFFGYSIRSPLFSGEEPRTTCFEQ